MKQTIIECDGGTPCNIPSKGYGDGYGSYRIDKGKVIRVEFKRPMSANEAETQILIEAIKDAIKQFGTQQDFNIISDSTIIVNHVEYRNSKKALRGIFSKGASQGYKNSVSELRWLLFSFSASAEWKPRDYMVRIFGH